MAGSAVNAQKVAQKFGIVNDHNEGRQSEVCLKRPNGLCISRRQGAWHQKALK